MDPLSITAATIGIADVSFRLSRFLTRTIRGVRDVDSDLDHLLGQVNNLISINNGIKTFTCAPDFEQTLRRSFRDTGPLAEPWEQLWRDTARVSTETERLLKRLEHLLYAVPEAHSLQSEDGRFRAFRSKARAKVDSIRTQLRKDSRSEEIGDVRQQLRSSQAALETCLTMIQLGWSIKAHQVTSDSLTGLRGDFASSMIQLQSQISSLQRVAPPESPLFNKIYQAPAASDLFTGRLALLNEVEAAFGLVTCPALHAAGVHSMSMREPRATRPAPTESGLSGSPPSDSSAKPGPISASSHGKKQKRFILVGLRDSGKTEFCRKFAEQNQPSFWGVFWIDASSDETARHSYREISHIGGVDDNIKAAMNWLAGLAHPWLLIIDNADDPNMEVENYFPGGERGHILVTTGRPALKHLGNVGRRFAELERLDENEAHDLLLKHAQEERPWTETAQILAKRITEVLGYLPLALVCAGRAIAEGITTLAEYISWFNDSWDRIRWHSRRSGRYVDETNKNVFAPYEAMLQSLGHENSQSAQDAIELLKLLSLLHHEDISFEIMVNAAKNPPTAEAQSRKKVDEEQRNLSVGKGTNTATKAKTWRRTIRDGIIQAVTWYEGKVLFPTLPVVLRNDKTHSFSVHRLRAALARLTQKSLVSTRRKGSVDVFSMHPLIHRWVRERPQMSLGERGLWCQAAITMLNQCIPLPPLGGEESEVAFRRQLLPHLDAVRKFQQEIQLGLAENLKVRTLSSVLLLRQRTMDRAKAQQYARFSRLYFECGRFQDAADLQEQVKDYAVSMLGLDDERTTLILLALSDTYVTLTRVNDAIVLQKQALETCEYALGPEHPRTLKVMDMLGKCECLRGRFKEARKLHEDALAGMQKVLPANHQDIFLAMDNLGVVWHRYFQYERAEQLHTQAVVGLTKALGKDHPDTLFAKENLALTCLEMTLNFGQEIDHERALEKGADSLQKAYALELEVLETRRKNMGKENNWTLWAISNLARIKSSLGYLDEAEADMRAALEIGIRNLGETHFGILFGKTHLGRVLTTQGRYKDAEDIFQDVIVKGSYDKGSRAEGETPDQLLAVWYYAGCCQLSGKTDKAIDLLQGLREDLKKIGATKHPFWDRVRVKLEELQNESRHRNVEEPEDEDMLGPVAEKRTLAKYTTW
ncbi:MAG: hypothetical protein L6R42_004297 [Xanthoria sp. 1 TBL-2021]|nr:MAG: hypothetical protein L6R42_004297 [Xanthoria sp. 1 TBL-2021]